MSKKQIQTLRKLDRLKYEDYLKFKAGERIYPPLDDGKCDCCGKHIRELKPFGGPGDPLEDDYTGALLVKSCAPCGPYIDEVEKAFQEAERYYKSDGFENNWDWLIDKYGEEKFKAFDYAHFYHHHPTSCWECRDCVILNMDEYSEILKRKLEKKGYQKPYYLPKGWPEEEY